MERVSGWLPSHGHRLPCEKWGSVFLLGGGGGSVGRPGQFGDGWEEWEPLPPSPWGRGLWAGVFGIPGGRPVGGGGLRGLGSSGPSFRQRGVGPPPQNVLMGISTHFICFGRLRSRLHRV